MIPTNVISKSQLFNWIIIIIFYSLFYLSYCYTIFSFDFLLHLPGEFTYKTFKYNFFSAWISHYIFCGLGLSGLAYIGYYIYFSLFFLFE